MRPTPILLKNAIDFTRAFFLSIILFIVASCGHPNYLLRKAQAKEVKITSQLATDSVIDKYIAPYRKTLDDQLNQPLSNAPKTIDKSGEWQTPMGNLLADLTIERGNPAFLTLKGKNIDGCLLNHGGIRTIIPQGILTARNAYEVMPFENSAVVIELDGATVLTLCQYILDEKKPHPLAGIHFKIAADGKASDVTIQGNPLDLSKHYYIVTSDYLANGGDAMLFFKKGFSRTDLNYKLRDMLIDYFKSHPSVEAASDVRIIKN
jgi:2',3'-cyclic-nucleotide 2'-phosphodiesterase (5'-nucleotidase family)